VKKTVSTTKARASRRAAPHCSAPRMSFAKAMKVLNIEDFADRIFNSNSHGELRHIWDYMRLAQIPGDKAWFRPWLLGVVEMAEKNWSRPESCFQHLVRFLQEMPPPNTGAESRAASARTSPAPCSVSGLEET